MLVKSTIMIFREGRRFRVDPATGLTDAFEVEIRKDKKMPDHYVPATTESVIRKGETPIPLKSRKELIALLHLAGVEFDQGATTDELGELLQGVQNRAAPGTTGRDKSEEILQGADVSREDVRAKLRAKGIPFKATASREELLDLLAPKEGPKGTGNQDVI